MDWFLIVCFIICLIFFLFYFINISMFKLLPSSIIIDFKKIATENNQLTKNTQYTINYINNNYLISDVGVLYIDTNTSLMNINFPFVSYTYDIVTNFDIIVPIVKALKSIS